MERRIRVAVAGVLALAAFGFLGAMDYSDALVQDAMEKEARPRRVADPLPSDYSIVLCQRTYYADRPACRYYITERK